MDDILDEVVSQQDLKKFEEAYNDELRRNAVTDQVKFEYAWCLVKSKYPVDIGKGIFLLNELCRNNVEDRRDYMYYLAVGHARSKKYSKAKEILNHLLLTEPTNNQVLQLQKQVHKKMESEAVVAVAKAGGALLLIGTIVGFGVALAKK